MVEEKVQTFLVLVHSQHSHLRGSGEEGFLLLRRITHESGDLRFPFYPGAQKHSCIACTMPLYR